MTEAEWLACDNPKALWAHCDLRTAERKKALLRVACSRSALAVTNQTEVSHSTPPVSHPPSMPSLTVYTPRKRLTACRSLPMPSKMLIAITKTC
jgi:hypothetical protein